MSLSKLNYNQATEKKTYVERSLNGVDNRHWGQRKLYMSEMYFLTRFLETLESKALVVYVGAGPGEHLDDLCFKFPKVHFDLYDTTKIILDKKITNATIYTRYFTNEDAERYSLIKDIPLFLISDIRNTKMRVNRKIETNKKNESGNDSLIEKDMAMQKEWCNIIKPTQALLKFRVSWYSDTTYFDGEVQFQLWAGNHSTELRLIPDLKKKLVKYYHKEIEEKCFFYNENVRPKLFTLANSRNPLNCYEYEMELQIFKDYLIKFDSSTTSKNVTDRATRLSKKLTCVLKKRKHDGKVPYHVVFNPTRWSRFNKNKKWK
jgi:hypothetical protein